MTRRLLFATRSLLAPLGDGGGEVSAHELLLGLAQTHAMSIAAIGAFTYERLHDLSCMLSSLDIEMTLNQQSAATSTARGLVTYPLTSHVEYTWPEMYPVTLARDDHFVTSWTTQLLQWQPDILLLQGRGAPECWRELTMHGAPVPPTFVYLRNVVEPTIFARLTTAVPRFIVNSRFLQTALHTRFGFESDVLYPALDIDRYREVPLIPHSRFTVLFVNPVAPKGLATVLHLVCALPDVQFLLLEGRATVDARVQSLLSERHNVTYLRRTWQMAAVYSSVDLAIVPSRCEETFGRVVVEAHAAGVPTIASRVGGLPEATGNAGMLVDDFANPLAWEAVMKEVLKNPGLLAETRLHCESNARRFTAEASAARFSEIVAGGSSGS